METGEAEAEDCAQRGRMDRKDKENLLLLLSPWQRQQAIVLGTYKTPGDRARICM